MILVEIFHDIFSRGSDQLVGRISGPLNLRLLITPTVSTILALKDGRNGAKKGETSFLWDVLRQTPAKRKETILAVRKSLKTVVLLAFVLDLAYQLYVFRAFYVFQTILLIFALAVVPYTVIRGVMTRIMNIFSKEIKPL